MLDDMSSDRERVISVSLSEAEWQAFVARHPQPVDWLRKRIRDEVQAPTDDIPQGREPQPAGYRSALRV
jgi:hypothetical protein